MVRPRILELRDYRNLWIGQTVSQLGDSVYMLVFLFTAEKVSGDPRVTGIVAALQALPFVLFSPVAGVVADRFDRRKVMLAADLSSALITGLLVGSTFLYPMPPPWLLGAAAFLLSSVNVFFMPARSAAIPRLVPKEMLVEANGFAMASQQTIAMVGIALSAGVLGVLFKVFPDSFFRTAVLVDALTFLGSAWFIRKLPSIVAVSTDDSVEGGGEAKKSIWKDFIVGAKAIRGDALARVALPLNVLGSLSISGFFVAYVVVNDEWFGGEFWKFALIEFAFAMVSTVMSVWFSKQKISRPGMHFALGTAGIGLLVVGMAFTRHYLVFMLLNAACGFPFPSMVIPINTYFQSAFPDEVRGRVNSTWSMVTMSAQPIGMMVVAFLLAVLKPEGALLVMGVGLALSGFLGLAFRSIRETRMA